MRNTIYIISFLAVSLIYSNVTAQKTEIKITPEEYIEKYKAISIEKMLRYKIPASITLAQGLLESGNGNSKLARKANNHFGIKCHQMWEGKTFHQDDDAKNECFRKYNNPSESFKDHSEFLTGRSRYAFLFNLNITDYKGWAYGLKKAGYATNPKYPTLLISLIERNNLHEYDKIGAKLISEQKSEKDIEKELSESNNNDIQTANKKLEILTRNRIKYIIARKGDTFLKISKETKTIASQLHKYNEISKNSIIKQGQIIYLQPKRNKGDVEFHTVKKGETIYSISQQHGIKLKCLYKKNKIKKGEKIISGQKLWLKKNKH